MAVSIADVAERAQVSISTVSRVINGRTVVNARTRERVESAIRELGYRPNAFARALMLRRSDIVGLVLPDLHGEFYSEIIRGANSRARELGFNLVISSSRDAGDGRSLLHAIDQRNILDGVALMVSEVTGGIQQALAGISLPFVVLDDDIDGAPHDSVVIDQRAGAAAMMDHLLRGGRAERVIFVGGLETNVDTIARLAAYQQALRAAGRAFSAEDVYFLDYSYETAFKLARRAVRAWAGPRHFVFAANDEMAAGIVAAATAEGLRVPADVGVVGFDDTRIARMTHPPLTTVSVPMSEMGARGIELLCERIRQPQRSPERVVLQPTLVVRDSCGCPSADAETARRRSPASPRRAR